MLSSYRWPRGIKFHIYLVKNKTNKKNQERKLQKKKKIKNGLINWVKTICFGVSLIS